MAFRIQLLFAYTALCLLALYNANASLASIWPKVEPRLTGFSWQNCGPGTDPLQVKSLNVNPDPVKVPGNLTASVSVGVTVALPTDIHASLTMEKKVAGFWIKVPCIDDVGSCTYNDICKDWADACPKYFEKYGLPCACPFPANTYTVPDVAVEINSKLPPGTSGDYRVTADIGSSTGHLGCIHVAASISG